MEVFIWYVAMYARVKHVPASTPNIQDVNIRAFTRKLVVTRGTRCTTHLHGIDYTTQHSEEQSGRSTVSLSDVCVLPHMLVLNCE